MYAQFFGLQLDRGNLSNALADTFLDDLGLTSDDYNNGNTIQLVCFMSAEFPVQFLTKRYVSSTKNTGHTHLMSTILRPAIACVGDG